jgi:hypothetical protein
MVTAKLSIVVHISFERGCPLHRNSGGYYRTIVTLGPPQNKIESNGVGNFVPNRAFIRYYRGHSIACGTGEQFA